MTATDDIDTLLAELDERHAGYFQRPLPDELDERIARFVERYEHEPQERREEVAAHLTVTQAQFLAAYAERGASLAITLRSARVLRSGLIALGLASRKEYFKEIVPVLALIHHSAEQLDVDPRALFADAGSVVVPAPEEYFREFPDRRPELRSLDAMGYEEHPSDTGLQYARTRTA